MRREDRFVLSHRPYAVDLSSLRVKVAAGWNGDYGHGNINAVWFRRKNGVTFACVGELWDSQQPVPADAAQFLAQHDDGRYGGRPFARWDGERFWSAGQDPDENDRHLELLRPMLADYPAVPDGWDGWWVF
jgi:hypothetical protein